MTPPASLQETIKRLREIAPRVNSEADKAAHIIKKVNDILGDTGIGVTAIVKLEHASIHFDTYLVYGRINGKMAIHIRESGDEGYREQHPWGSCSRTIKLLSVAAIPSLLDNILSGAEDLATIADETSQAIKGLMESLCLPAS